MSGREQLLTKILFVQGENAFEQFYYHIRGTSWICSDGKFSWLGNRADIFRTVFEKIPHNQAVNAAEIFGS